MLLVCLLVSYSGLCAAMAVGSVSTVYVLKLGGSVHLIIATTKKRYHTCTRTRCTRVNLQLHSWHHLTTSGKLCFHKSGLVIFVCNLILQVDIIARGSAA